MALEFDRRMYTLGLSEFRFEMTTAFKRIAQIQDSSTFCIREVLRRLPPAELEVCSRVLPKRTRLLLAKSDPQFFSEADKTVVEDFLARRRAFWPESDEYFRQLQEELEREKDPSKKPLLRRIRQVMLKKVKNFEEGFAGYDIEPIESCVMGLNKQVGMYRFMTILDLSTPFAVSYHHSITSDENLRILSNEDFLGTVFGIGPASWRYTDEGNALETLHQIMLLAEYFATRIELILKDVQAR